MNFGALSMEKYVDSMIKLRIPFDPSLPLLGMYYLILRAFSKLTYKFGPMVLMKQH